LERLFEVDGLCYCIKVEAQKRIDKAVKEALENERQQIRMELHDNVKQVMATSLLNIDFLQMIINHEDTTVPTISKVKIT
jgi:signal transduction histidine kinase